jgi:CRISPR/Cas system CSM-associated protein Csm3 (group 7 of RAMP superfamily)
MAKIAPLQRVDYSFVLEVLSALHIGTGETRLYVPEGKTADQGWHIQTIVRDHEDKPFLPGSSIKGLLRGIARQLGDDGDVLFGSIRQDNTGRMGALQVRGASQIKPGVASGLPYAKDGVFITARTAIDGGRGISETNKLFHAEAVAPEARFCVRLRLEVRADLQGLEQLLLKILAQLSVAEGVGLGADGASGLGRIRLVEKVSCTSWSLDAKSGALRADREQSVFLSEPVIHASSCVELVLGCDGPYLQNDFSWDKDQRQQEKNKTQDEDAAHLKPLRRKEVPYLTGDSVSGFLRARLNWLKAVADMRKEDADYLNSERLFGKTGERARLTVRITHSRAGGTMKNTSLRVDRFSGGAIDNALFVTESDYGVRFRLVLELDGRASEDDDKALKALEADICQNGLQLGHGTGKGFGWFRVEEENAG